MGGNGAPKTISLNCPTDVMLDANGNLFILDACDNRIVGSGPNGFQCIIGCSNSGGSAANQILKSQSMAFDSYGNIYVADYGNARIQLFTLSNILWDDTTTDTTTDTSQTVSQQSTTETQK
ncbi:unnamed protein product, partial [Adineta ricciae]